MGNDQERDPSVGPPRKSAEFRHPIELARIAILSVASENEKTRYKATECYDRGRDDIHKPEYADYLSPISSRISSEKIREEYPKVENRERDQ